MSNYSNLVVWQKADKLALMIYRHSEDFPRHEMFGITQQLRRAALSIPTNIVEGYNKKSNKELSRFLEIALGSLAETEYLIYFAQRLGYFKVDIREVKSLVSDVGRLLWGFQRSKA